MSRGKRLPLILSIVVFLVLLDQASKLIALQVLDYNNPIDYFGGTFRWILARNRGAFLSLGSNLGDPWRFWLLTVLNGVILVVVGLFLLRKAEIPKPMTIALSLIFAGGLGNQIDRVFRSGEVIDFMNLGIQEWVRTGVFNVADLAIVGGLVMLILIELRGGKQAEDALQESEPPAQ